MLASGVPQSDSGVPQSDSVVHIYIYVCVCVCILFQILFPYSLSQNIEYSSLYLVGPCWLSIFYLVVSIVLLPNLVLFLTMLCVNI